MAVCVWFVYGRSNRWWSFSGNVKFNCCCGKCRGKSDHNTTGCGKKLLVYPQQNDGI